MRENLNEKSSLKEGYKIQLGQEEIFDLEDFVMTYQRFNKGSGEWNKVRREVAGGNPMLVEGMVGYPGCGGILEFVGFNPTTDFEMWVLSKCRGQRENERNFIETRCLMVNH